MLSADSRPSPPRPALSRRPRGRAAPRKLPPAGAPDAEEVHRALAQLCQATPVLRSNPDGGTLALSILPAFGRRWLGVALLSIFVAKPYRRAGTLELAAPDCRESIGSYYPVWPGNRPESAAPSLFRRWLAKAPDPARPEPPQP